MSTETEQDRLNRKLNIQLQAAQDTQAEIKRLRDKNSVTFAPLIQALQIKLRRQEAAIELTQLHLGSLEPAPKGKKA